MITAPREEFSKPLAVHTEPALPAGEFGGTQLPRVILSRRRLVLKKVPIELKSGNSQNVKRYRGFFLGGGTLNHLFSPFHFKVP